MTGNNRQPPRDQSSSSSRPKRGNRRRRGGRGRLVEHDAPLLQFNEEVAKRIAAKFDVAEFVVFDIETTGGNPEKNGITEIFALRYGGGEVKGTYYTMVNPGIPIPPIVRRMTGIDNKMVRDQPRIDAVMADILAFIGDDVLVSHNTIGDMKFLRHFAKQVCNVEMQNFYLCTHLLVEKLAPETPDKSLTGLAKYFKLASGDLHRAEADAYVTLELFKVLMGRLKERSVTKVDEAIRMQGDLESGMRLGWAVDLEALGEIPPGPGVFYLYDHERKLLFLSSAMQLNREIPKLKAYAQLPRQLLRLVLKSYDIQISRAANPYAAMLEECEALQSHKLNFHPANWHQRSLTAFYMTVDEASGIEIGIGNVAEGTRYAFGPVRDRRIAAELLEGVAKALGGKFERETLRVGTEHEKLLVSLFTGALDAEYKELLRQSRAISMWFKPAERKAIKARGQRMKDLLAIKWPSRIENLLLKSGVLIVPDKNHGGWQVHHIVGSRPRGSTPLRGDPDQKLRQGGLAKRIGERIQKETSELTAHTLPRVEVARVNATLWWIYNGRGDCRFIPLNELLEFEESVQPSSSAPVALGDQSSPQLD